MPAINNLSATTELDAVNEMLAAVGEQPVDSVDTARADVELAVNTLRATARTLQNQRWKFNTEFGLAIGPADEALAWTDPNGDSKTLFVFTPPAGLSRWELAMISEQADFDVTVRPAKVYTEDDEIVNVFYDRTNNRDGFEEDELKDGLLWINATWCFDFDKLPDTARRYVVLCAARRFIMERIGDTHRTNYTAADEQEALRVLREDQGDDDEYSLLDSPDVSGILGGRIQDRGRALDFRSNP